MIEIFFLLIPIGIISIAVYEFVLAPREWGENTKSFF